MIPREGIILHPFWFSSFGVCGRREGERGRGGLFCSSITARACEIAYTDYPYGMFFLTRGEQMVVIFILTSLFLGAGIRHYRLERMLPSQSHTSH